MVGRHNLDVPNSTQVLFFWLELAGRGGDGATFLFVHLAAAA